MLCGLRSSERMLVCAFCDMLTGTTGTADHQTELDTLLDILLATELDL